MDSSSKLYAERYLMNFIGQLGEGKDGCVLQTNHLTAVKFLTSSDHFNREVRAYRLLAANRIDEIGGHEVPRLVREDEAFLAIEMSIVRPPFLLDFVSTYTDDEMDWLNFGDEILEERQVFWSEVFGVRWDVVQQICDEFHKVTGLAYWI